MSLTISSITFNTARLQDMLRFYRILGIHFTPQTVEKGGEFYRAQLGSIEFNLHPQTDIERSVIPGFHWALQVANLEQILGELKSLGADVLLTPATFTNGEKAIVLDPEGRALELIQHSSL